MIAHKLLHPLKKIALPEEYADAYPKRLRFSVFTVMGRLVSHAGQLLLRVANGILKEFIAPGRERIRGMIWHTS